MLWRALTDDWGIRHGRAHSTHAHFHSTHIHTCPLPPPSWISPSPSPLGPLPSPAAASHRKFMQVKGPHVVADLAVLQILILVISNLRPGSEGGFQLRSKGFPLMMPSVA